MDSLAKMEAAMNRLTKGQSAGSYRHIQGFKPNETKTVPDEPEPTAGLGFGGAPGLGFAGVQSVDDLHKKQAMAAAAKAAAAIKLSIPAAPSAAPPAAPPAAPAAPPARRPGREKRRFSEGPASAPAGDADKAVAKDQGQLEKAVEIAEEKAQELTRAEKRAKRKSKWDVAGPDAAATVELSAPTAAQLSACHNPYELKNFVDGLKQSNQAYEQLQTERKMGASVQYATGNMMENEDGTGVHHFDHFIPKDALSKFYTLASGEKEQPKAPQIDMSNKGAQMMAKMGFTAGQGLGAQGTGMTSAIDAGAGNALKLGVGVAKETWEPQQGDDSFTLYRKRMMLGYKHRPNPLNNPRSSYY